MGTFIQVNSSDYTTTIVNITSAQLKTDLVTGINLNLPKAVGKYLAFSEVIFEFIDGGTPYTVDGTEFLVLYSSNFNAIYTCPDAVLVNTADGAAVRTQVDLGYNSGLNTYQSDNEDWILSIFTPTQGVGTLPTLGNGTLRMIVTYTVRTFGI